VRAQCNSDGGGYGSGGSVVLAVVAFVVMAVV
jgi:hypothetical protein